MVRVWRGWKCEPALRRAINMKLRSLLLAGVCILALVGACSGSDAGPSGTLSQQGESCQRSADCASGLACFSGTCRPADADVRPNNRECVAIQCEEASECCDVAWERSATCSSYEAECAAGEAYACSIADGPECSCSGANWACEQNLCVPVECQAREDCCNTAWAPASSSCDTYAEYCADGEETYCEAFESYCVCDEDSFDCVEHTCVEVDSCTDDSDCPSDVCADGRCVDCESDDDCSDDDAECVDNACVTPECETNLDCPAFYACQEGECVHVGCATDRECMIAEDSYLATCDQSASPVPKCEVQCSSDAECGDASNPLRVCASGRCIDPGCETDEECKLILAESVFSLRGARAVCRDKDD